MILLDASAALALLKGERGQDREREAVLAGSAITTVNLAEVVGRYVMEGAQRGLSTDCGPSCQSGSLPLTKKPPSWRGGSVETPDSLACRSAIVAASLLPS